VRRPRQHAERGGIGDHEEVATALHLGHAKTAPGREDRECRLVRGILGQERGRHRATVAHRCGGVARHDRLSAQNAVLVGKREAHDLEPIFLDPLVGLDRGFVLFVVPQSVALDEAVRSSLLR
jgi:hypothetical protein